MYGEGMTKADLHRLIDELAPESVDAVGRWLERVADDPMIAVLDAAPWDDEPSTPEEEAAVAEAREAIAELRKVYEAKLAEREILYHSSLGKTAEPEARETLEQEYRRDRERLTSERDRKIEELRKRER